MHPLVPLLCLALSSAEEPDASNPFPLARLHDVYSAHSRIRALMHSSRLGSPKNERERSVVQTPTIYLLDASYAIDAGRIVVDGPRIIGPLRALGHPEIRIARYECQLTPPLGLARSLVALTADADVTLVLDPQQRDGTWESRVLNIDPRIEWVRSRPIRSIPCDSLVAISLDRKHALALPGQTAALYELPSGRRIEDPWLTQVLDEHRAMREKASEVWITSDLEHLVFRVWRSGDQNGNGKHRQSYDWLVVKSRTPGDDVELPVPGEAIVVAPINVNGRLGFFCQTHDRRWIASIDGVELYSAEPNVDGIPMDEWAGRPDAQVGSQLHFLNADYLCESLVFVIWDLSDGHITSRRLPLRSQFKWVGEESVPTTSHVIQDDRVDLDPGVKQGRN